MSIRTINGIKSELRDVQEHRNQLEAQLSELNKHIDRLHKELFEAECKQDKNAIYSKGKIIGYRG